MTLETRNFTSWEAILWIYQNNPNVVYVHYNAQYQPDYLVSEIPIERLKLPDGWYYKKRKGITNKHNSSTRTYSCIKIVQRKN